MQSYRGRKGTVQDTTRFRTAAFGQQAGRDATKKHKKLGCSNHLRNHHKRLLTCKCRAGPFPPTTVHSAEAELRWGWWGWRASMGCRLRSAPHFPRATNAICPSPPPTPDPRQRGQGRGFRREPRRESTAGRLGAPTRAPPTDPRIIGGHAYCSAILREDGVARLYGLYVCPTHCHRQAS